MLLSTLKPLLFGFLATSLLPATDLTIHLPNSPEIMRKTVRYACDSSGKAIGVPASPFPVEYINGGGNSLAVVPISGNALIFSSVISGSGARYTARQYTWWEAKGTVTLSSSTDDKLQSSCRPVTAK